MKYPQLVSMPSAVSDWLEEQLEARGIDAVVYTRYILSLLHSDTVDVIYSDEDLHFSHLKKEVRRSGGSRKRVRRSSDWWKYAQADAEKLKRSAAVECLMSASEQTCGIESLIDELCEKLNDIKSDVHQADPPAKKANPELQQFSPQELAKRYYAAFPPLNRNTSSNSPSKLISLIPKWIPSPKKKPNYRKQNNRSYEENMKANRAMNKRVNTLLTGHNNNNNNNNNKEVESDWTSPKSNAQIVPKLEESYEDWSTGGEANLYELPVDIQELLDDSKIRHDVTVEMMNLANMRDTGRRGFIPCGTNIKSSIWTNRAVMEEDNSLFDNNYNSAIIGTDRALDFHPRIGTRSDWKPAFGDLTFVDDNGFNELFDNQLSICNLESCFEDDWLYNLWGASLTKLNHKKEMSAFAEVVPRKRTTRFNAFSKIVGSGVHRDTSLKTVEPEKDDLLTSVHSHFRPINEKVDSYMQGEYADGATFQVLNNWDKINYRRTESGAMYMESDYGLRKKYCEYKARFGQTKADFVLKYLVSQNDKACQTEEVDAEVDAITSDRQVEECSDVKEATKYESYTFKTLATNKDYSLGDCPKKDANCALEAAWKQPCDKCNNNSFLFWDTQVDGLTDEKELGWQFGSISKIWGGGVVCNACLGRPSSTQQHSKLREDISQDGDQLLSDLSTIQKSYMQESLPMAEHAFISELIMPKERKRRHSLMTSRMDDCWSFASRLEEDCLIQIAIPTLRSVTL